MTERWKPGTTAASAAAEAGNAATGHRQNWLKKMFFATVIRPLVMVVLGLNVRRREMLPLKGPAVIIANHNSHLDTLTLMALAPLANLPGIRPVAAADYFLQNRLLRFIALDLIGIIPIVRGGAFSDPIAACRAALDRGEVLILFPEGTRGEGEKLNAFKRGVGHLARSRPDVPVVPVFMHGLGKSLPKGSWLLVPFFCDVFVGQPFRWSDGDTDLNTFMRELEGRVQALAAEGKFATWD